MALVTATAKEVSFTTGYPLSTVYEWVRREVCVVKRTPGVRGRVLLVVDADGWPLTKPPAPAE
jgi:hypothetical protein